MLFLPVLTPVLHRSFAGLHAGPTPSPGEAASLPTGPLGASEHSPVPPCGGLLSLRCPPARVLPAGHVVVISSPYNYLPFLEDCPQSLGFYFPVPGRVFVGVLRVGVVLVVLFRFRQFRCSE